MTNHPSRSKKETWDADSPLTAEVCALLGWDASIHPIETRRGRSGVEVHGTLLKPNEWMELCLITQSKLSDGSTLIVCDVPTSAVDLSRNTVIRRQGRAVLRRHGEHIAVE